MADVTVVIPTIIERKEMLAAAVASVNAQTVPVELIVATDLSAGGASETRSNGLAMVDTEWVAFLDDDDLMDPCHVEVCLDWAKDHDADLVYPWHRVGGMPGAHSDFLQTRLDGRLVSPFGVPFGPEQEARLRETNWIPVTVICRTDLAMKVGGFRGGPVTWWNDQGEVVPEGSPDAKERSLTEEWHFQLRMLDAGAKFSHVPAKTWTWMHHGRNTSGLPEAIHPRLTFAPRPTLTENTNA